MFVKEDTKEINGKIVFKIHGRWIYYNTNDIDDTFPEVQDKLLRIVDRRFNSPFYIQDLNKSSSIRVTLTHLGYGVIPTVFYYRGFWFVYDSRYLTPYKDFDVNILDEFIDTYMDRVVCVSLTKDGDWYVDEGPY